MSFTKTDIKSSRGLALAKGRYGFPHGSICFSTESGSAIPVEKLEDAIKAYTAAIHTSYLLGLAEISYKELNPDFFNRKSLKDIVLSLQFWRETLNAAI